MLCDASSSPSAVFLYHASTSSVIMSSQMCLVHLAQHVWHLLVKVQLGDSAKDLLLQLRVTLETHFLALVSGDGEIKSNIKWNRMKISVEGSLEVKLPTIWTNEKQRWEESEKRREEERKSKKRKSQKKEDADCWKGRKVAKHCVFPMIWGSGGSKSRLAKAAGAEPAGQMRDAKIARRCGAKHISKSKCTKHTRVGPLLEVEMSKKCTPLWREAHFEVKSVKNWRVRSTFGSWDVETVHAVVARSTFQSQKLKKWAVWSTFGRWMSFCVAGTRDSAPCQKWAKRERFVAVSPTTTTTLHYTPLHHTTTTTTATTATTTTRH